jgi:hypothetical protein
MEIEKTSKHNLEFSKALIYVKKYLSKGNSLSKYILENHDFQEGRFYTLLPSNAKFDRLYEFPYGGILPQEAAKMKFIKSLNKEVLYSPLTSVENELFEFIYNFLKKDLFNITVLEDVIQNPQDPHVSIQGVDLAVFKNEVYFFLKANTPFDLIKEATKTVNYTWHTLIVLTNSNIPISTHLQNVDFANVCNSLSCMIVGAYDGESYVFWEKTT